MLGAICGRARAGEQALLARLVRRRPELAVGRVICFDRNFPGYDLITAVVAAGGHVVARVKEGISLPSEPGGGWLPDGSRLTRNRSEYPSFTTPDVTSDNVGADLPAATAIVEICAGVLDEMSPF
jgi:hypothetical protein